MIFVGYLYGIRSERRLVEEIKYNLTYRLFLGIGLRESVPNSSTISQNRRRRFRGTDIYERIFENKLEQVEKPIANYVDELEER